MEYIVTFGSTHRALKAERILKEKGIRFKLIPTPKKLIAFCDLSILFEEKERAAIENAFKDGVVKTTALYRKEGDDYKQITQIAKADSTDKG